MCCAASYHPVTRNKGSVLVLLLAVSVLITVLGSGMLTLGYHNRVRMTRTTQQMAARVAADAGLTRAIYTLDAQFTAGSLTSDNLPAAADVTIPNFDGCYTYTVSQDGLGSYTIVATGTYENAQVNIEGVMTGAGMTHEYALLTQGDLTLRNSATIDWYNGDGSDGLLKIGTNSTETGKITLYNRSYINGDVLVGAGGNPGNVINDNGGSYAGTAYAQAVAQPIPAVVVPDTLAAGPAQDAITGNTTISRSGKYCGISLGNSKKLIIDGNVMLYITGDVVLNKSAVIEINEGASLVLYVDGSVVGKNGSQFNNKTKDPRSLKLLGTDDCQDVELKNSGDMYAIVYAPEADTVLHNSATIWGAVTAKTCELKNSASFYYDASLADYQDPLFSELKLASWREY